MKIKADGKRKRVSKKKKESWRKHIDIEDVDNFQEEQRLEERLGTSFKDAENESLFIVDTSKVDVTLKDIKPLTNREQRKLNALKPPKSLAGLINTSKVPPLMSIRKPLTKKEKIINKKKLAAARKRAEQHKHIEPKKRQSNKDTDKDIWIETPNIIKNCPEGLKSKWIGKRVIRHHMTNTGIPVATIPKAILAKTSKLTPIELPHPGLSYNPTLEDHQDLLAQLIESEEKVIKSEDHLNRVTASRFTKMTKLEKERAEMAEMASGLPLNSDDSDSDSTSEDDNGDPYDAVNPPSQNKKKNLQKRRKQNEQRLIKAELMSKKIEKKKVTDLHKLKVLKEEVSDTLKEVQEKRKRRCDREEEKNFTARKLGPIKFVTPEIDINMIEDIKGNLRNLKMEGSLLKDRFKSFQKRNILAPSVDTGLRRRRPVKRFTRNTHKEIPSNAIKKSNKIITK